jgi:cytochrome c oxidase cbb3-type subunit 3
MNSSSMCGTRHLWPLRCAVTVLLCALGSVFGQTALAQTSVARSKTATRPSNEGKAIFESACAGCHGLDGRGGERGPDIATRQPVVQLSDGQIQEILQGGRPAAGMPPFAALGATKLNAVLAYLRSLQGRGTTVVLPGDPQKGKALFFGNARCSECHMVGGMGGFLGRDLTFYGANLSPKEIHSNIVNPGESSGRSNKTAVITMRGSQTLSGVIRNEDNFSVQLQSFDGSFHLLKKSDVTKLGFLPDPIMPNDYGKTLSAAEIDDLVSYLLTAARATTTAKGNPDDEAE